MPSRIVSSFGASFFVLLGLSTVACKPDPPPVAPTTEDRSCRDACGEGTRFAATKCVIDWNAGICVPPEKLEELTAKYEDWSICPVDPRTLPPFRRMSTKKIPGYDPKKTRVQSFSGGTEQLDEYAIEQHFKEFEDLVYDCLTVAACYNGGHPGAGTLEFELGVMGDGSITGINVRASKNLRRWGVDRCAKKMLYECGFATYDGEQEAISYEMMIEGPDEEVPVEGTQ